MVLLDVVHGILSLCTSNLIGEVELVEVDLTVLLAAHPIHTGTLEVCNRLIGAVGSIRLIPDIEIARRHVLPIVRLRIIGVVVVKFCTCIHAVETHQRGGQLGLLVNLVVPGEQSRWSPVIDDT